MSKHDRDFSCLYCVHWYRTKNKLESHKKSCKKKDFCKTEMPSEDTKVLEINQYQISDKTPFIVSQISDRKKIDGCKNNPEKSSTTKLGQDIPSGFSVSTVS